MEDMMLNMRLAKQSDLETIMNIEKICFPKAEAASSKEFRERFEVFGDCFFVAEKENQIVGFINGCKTDQPLLPDELYHDTSLHCPQGKYQTVFGLDVLPQYQHQGIAQALMNAFIDNAKKQGCLGMVLTCKNHLIGFYEQFGYVHQGISASNHGGAQWNDMLLIFKEHEEK